MWCATLSMLVILLVWVCFCTYSTYMVPGKQNCNNRRWKDSREKKGGKESQVKQYRNTLLLQGWTIRRKIRSLAKEKKRRQEGWSREMERVGSSQQFGLSWEGSVHPTHIKRWRGTNVPGPASHITEIGPSHSSNRFLGASIVRAQFPQDPTRTSMDEQLNL